MQDITVTSDSKVERYQQFLRMLNFLIPPTQSLVTESEIQALSYFLSLPPKFEHHRFQTAAKKRVLQMYKDDGYQMTNNNLTTKIGLLLNNKILQRDEDRMITLSPHINQYIQQFHNNQIASVQLNFKVLNEDSDRPQESTKTHIEANQPDSTQDNS